MDKRKIKIFVGFIFVIIVLSLNKPEKKIIKTISQPQVKGLEFHSFITAQVGENYLTLSGYTSPLAKIYLTSSLGNLKRETIADKQGFFLFQFVFLPQKTGELCLVAEDLEGLVSPPLFLPEPPPNQNLVIQDILMPPTLSLSEGEILPRKTAAAFGKTFPNSKVLVYQYLDPKFSLSDFIIEKIIKPAFAKTAPILEVESDDDGNFEFNLPSSQPSDLKIFVASIFQKPEFFPKNYSPKSFTLSFKTLSWWELILNFLFFLLAKIYLLFEKIIQDPTRILWLEIPLLAILSLLVLIRSLKEKFIGSY